MLGRVFADAPATSPHHPRVVQPHDVQPISPSPPTIRSLAPWARPPQRPPGTRGWPRPGRPLPSFIPTARPTRPLLPGLTPKTATRTCAPWGLWRPSLGTAALRQARVCIADSAMSRPCGLARSE